MAPANLTRACIAPVFPGLAVIDSDRFLGVTEELTLRAGRLCG